MAAARPSYRFATEGPDGVRWLLMRNCSLTPTQLLAAYGFLSLVSLSVAGFFWAMGAKLVLLFASLELLALGVAFLLYARHAVDRECIHLGPASLVVEWESGGRLERHEWARHTVRVVSLTGRQSLVELQAGRQSVRVGRYVRPDLRGQLATELRHALHGVGFAQG